MAMSTGRPQWFADVVRAGLETGILTEPDVLAHVTPAVLVAEMPAEIVIDVLAAALDAGAISPKSVLATVTPELLAEHVAHRLLWTCIAAAADRAGIPVGTNEVSDKARELLRRILERGLANKVISPKHIVDHVTAAVLGHNFPDALKTKLLEVTLASGKMTPDIVVETLGVEAIAKHAPAKVVWACIAEIGDAPLSRLAAAGEIGSDRAVTVPAAGVAAGSGPAPKLEVVDDDLESLQVDLDDAIASIDARPTTSAGHAPAPAPASASVKPAAPAAKPATPPPPTKRV